MFKAITRRDEDEPKPEARRRRGETGKGLGAVLHRAAEKTGAVARGRYAALQPAKVESSACAADPYAATTAYLSGTFVDLDCMNPYWPPDAEYDAAIDEHFSSQEDRYFPQP